MATAHAVGWSNRTAAESGHTWLSRLACSELWQVASPRGGLRLPYWPCPCLMDAAVTAALALEESLQLQQQRTKCQHCCLQVSPWGGCFRDGYIGAMWLSKDAKL